ncbi:MAG: AAA family ATPase [Acholeplasmataceae bacterium]|nr:AAA family ATPase [Acholeplasmataceae bacterium]
MLVLIGPSASGKTEVAKILMAKYGMKKMVTYTTRPMRLNEQNGIDYHFVSVPEFQKLAAASEFIETTFYNNNYYGTRKCDAAPDKVVILDPNGLRKFSEALKNEITAVYLETPKMLRAERMRLRHDSPDLIERRLANDDIVFIKEDLPLDYVLINDGIDLETLADEVYDLYRSKLE